MPRIARLWTPADLERPPVLWHRMDVGNDGAVPYSVSEEGYPCVAMASPEGTNSPVRGVLEGLGKVFTGGFYGWSGTAGLMGGADSCAVAFVGTFDAPPVSGAQNNYLSMCGADGATVLRISQGTRVFPDPGGGGIEYPDRGISILHGRIFALAKDL